MPVEWSIARVAAAPLLWWNLQVGAAMIRFGHRRPRVPRWPLYALTLVLLAMWPWASFKVNTSGFEPYMCPNPSCRRVIWTRADTTFCHGDKDHRHSAKEMQLISRADAPDFNSPGIITT